MSFTEQLKTAVIIQGLEAKREAEFRMFVAALLGFHAIAKHDTNDLASIEASQALDNLFSLINQDFVGLSPDKKQIFIDKYCEELKIKGDAHSALQKRMVTDVSQAVVDNTIKGGQKHIDETESEYRLLLSINEMFGHHNALWAAGKTSEANRYFDSQIESRIHQLSAEKSNKIFYSMAVEFSRFSKKVPGKDKVLSPECAQFVAMGNDSVGNAVRITTILNAVVDSAMLHSGEAENNDQLAQQASKSEAAKHAIASILAKVTPKKTITAMMTPGLTRFEHATENLSIESLIPLPNQLKIPKDIPSSKVSPEIHSFSDFYNSIKAGDALDVVVAVQGLYDKLTETPEGAFLLMGRTPGEMIIQISNDNIYNSAYAMLGDIDGALNAINEQHALDHTWSPISNEIQVVQKRYESLNEKFVELKNSLVAHKHEFLELNSQREVLQRGRDELKQQYEAALAERNVAQLEIREKIDLSDVKSIALLRRELHDDLAQLLPPGERFLFNQMLKKLGEDKERIITQKQGFLDRTFGRNIAEAVVSNPEIRPELNRLTKQFWLEVERDIYSKLKTPIKEVVDQRIQRFDSDEINAYLKTDRKMLDETKRLSSNLNTIGHAMIEKDVALKEVNSKQRQISYTFMSDIKQYQREKADCYKAARVLMNKISTLKVPRNSNHLEALKDFVDLNLEKLGNANKSVSSLETKIQLGTAVIGNAMSRTDVAQTFKGDLVSRSKRHDREAITLPDMDEELSNWQKFQFNVIDMSAVAALDTDYKGKKTNLALFTESIKSETAFIEEQKLDKQRQEQALLIQEPAARSGPMLFSQSEATKVSTVLSEHKVFNMQVRDLLRSRSEHLHSGKVDPVRTDRQKGLDWLRIELADTKHADKKHDSAYIRDLVKNAPTDKGFTPGRAFDLTTSGLLHKFNGKSEFAKMLDKIDKIPNSPEHKVQARSHLENPKQKPKK